MMAVVDRFKPQKLGYYKYHDIILGKGSFATVYLAHHRIIGCEVALKIINIDNIEEDYVYVNLEREAHILRDLDHPNIIHLYETIKSVNLYCLSLERIRGHNLEDYIMKQKDHRISENQARIYFYQMLSAVDYMHSLQVIHRDLKLQNILVEFGHVIKIIDFGLSNVYYPCERLRTHCGSREYAAPELFHAIPYGLAVDVWSLGVILYRMVVGQMPFQFSRDVLKHGNNPPKKNFSQFREEFLQRISKGLIQENWEMMEGLTPECWNILHSLLEPDQFRRIQIKEAMTHHWIKRDTHLKYKIPQQRKDLQRKFYPEIIEYLAHMLNTSKTRIEKRINAGDYNNSIASMFYIMRDILMKDVLYPPRNFQTSFFYRFECWKENRIPLFPLQRCSNEYSYRNEKLKEKAEKDPFAKSQPAKIDNEHNSSLKTNLKTTDEDDLRLHSHSKKADSIKSRVTRKEKNSGDSEIVSKGFDTISNDGNVEQEVSRIPYRSYKNSRPVNIKKVSDDKTKQNSDDLKHDMRAKSSILIEGKTYEKEYRSSHHQNSLHKEYKVGKKESNESHIESSTATITDTPKKQSMFITPIKPKTLISNTTKPTNTENKFCSMNIPKEPYSTSSAVSDLKNSEPWQQKTNVIKRILKNSTPKSTVSKKIPENYAVVYDKEQSGKDLSWADRSKNVSHSTTPRIPLKNMRYGPPAPSAPFSQLTKSDKTKIAKRTTVADRINHCRGDTNEKLRRK